MVGLEVLCSALIEVIAGLASYYQRRMVFRCRSFARLWPYNCFPQFQYFSSLDCQAQFHFVCVFWPVVDLTFPVGGDLNDSQCCLYFLLWLTVTGLLMYCQVPLILPGESR